MDQSVGWRRVVGHAIVLSLAGGVGVVILWAMSGGTMAEKVLTRIALPAGLFGVCLWGSSYMAIARGRRALACWLVFLSLLYTVLGSSAAGDWALRALESPYAAKDTGHYDTLIVLGGGTATRPDGGVQLTGAGDRVMQAARMYHTGRARHLVTTGGTQPWKVGRALSAADGTARIWQDLGIPSTAISRLGGHSTSEEIREIRQYLADHDRGRVGLLTSASHVPRAARLADRAGLTVAMVAADFQTGHPEPFPLSCIPSHFGFAKWNLAVRERLAGLFGR